MAFVKSNIVEEELYIRRLLDEVPDPEVPVLSVTDLGIVRDVRVIQPGKSVEIAVTPTYSGCPAMDVIRINIRMMLLKSGYATVKINTVLTPAWTTDWMSEEGARKLKAYGIAPPGKRKNGVTGLFFDAEAVECPQCRSRNTRLISEFGSTACKSLHQCNDCNEPFDHFKCH